MSFGTSDTYIYTYIMFACVYLAASVLFVVNALRVSTGLSRSHTETGSTVTVPTDVVREVLGHGQRLVDYTQIATLLPLAYIVGSMFLGSMIVRDTEAARTINVGWVAFTLLCAAVSIVLAGLGVRETGAIRKVSADDGDLSRRASDALQKIGVRLGVSAALLLLVAVFTMLNLWSVLGNLDVLSGVDFLL